jgi:hypothetical protein
MVDEWGNYSDEEEEVSDIETTDDVDDIEDEIEEAQLPDLDDDDEEEIDDNSEDIDDTEEVYEDDSTDEDIEYEYPDYVPEDLIIPEQFKNEKEELEWYKAKYISALEIPKHDAMKKFIVEEYKEHLLQSEDDFLKLKAIKDAFDGNPKGLFKMYFGKELEEAGTSFALSDEDKNAIVARKLSEEFGDDYYLVYDPTKVDNPNSMSAKMLKRNNELFAEVSKAQEPQAPNLAPIIDEAYEKHFKMMDRADYDKFINEAKSYQIGIKDLYNAIKHDEIVESAYKEGLIAGRKEVGSELRTQSRKVKKTTTYTQPIEDEDTNIEADEYGSHFFK